MSPSLYEIEYISFLFGGLNTSFSPTHLFTPSSLHLLFYFVDMVGSYVLTIVGKLLPSIPRTVLYSYFRGNWKFDISKSIMQILSVNASYLLDITLYVRPARK
eukprot:756083_1